MPIGNAIGSYLTTLDAFLAHYAEVNVALGGTLATDLVLQGNFKIVDMTTMRTGFQSALTTIVGTDNGEQTTAGQRDILKAAIKARLAQFRSGVAAYLGGTPYEAALPTLPDFSSIETKFLTPLDDMANLWPKINADVTTPGWTAPLLLAGGYTAANYVTDLAGMRAGYKSARDAIEAGILARKQRDALMPPIKDRLKQYGKAVRSKFTANDPLVTSLPALSPPPGHTPKAVAASGSYDATQQKGIVTWIGSTDANLSHYSVRTCSGTKYKAANETVVADLPPGTTSYATAVGLAAPGAKALFRVYVVLSTGNEKGSATVEITRPG